MKKSKGVEIVCIENEGIPFFTKKDARNLRF
jgi:hypothetical protein